LIDSIFVKQKAVKLGADICNIAAVDRFKDAPTGFHPQDIYPECQSVVVFLSHFPLSPLQCSSLAPYTFIRNMMVKKIEDITFRLCDELEQAGAHANPIPCDEPYEYWDEEKKHGRGILSLKHAGMLAGLGTIGKNTLLINKHFGNMMWIGAVLTSIPLESDPMADYEGCIDGCTQCLDVCPCTALDGTTITQKLCRDTSFSWSPGGGTMYECNACRTVCPNCAGIS
jgi:epoxyqueuosine reductase